MYTLLYIFEVDLCALSSLITTQPIRLAVLNLSWIYDEEKSFTY